MAWNPMVVNHGDRVDTPQGQGVVKRVSSTNGTAHVEMDGGKLFEIPLKDVTKKASPFKAGDKVAKRDNPSSTGKVTDTIDGGLVVKWDANGKRRGYTNREAGLELQLTTNQPETAKQPKPEEPEDSKPQANDTPPSNSVEQTGQGLEELFKLKQYMEGRIDTKVNQELQELKALAKAHQKLEVKTGDKTSVIKGLKHKQLEQLITYAALRLSPLLVGMAGTGKTHAAEQVAEALSLNFYSMSVGAQTSKSDIIGYMSASGNYVTTHFRKAYEEGGVFLMDEIDAGNANVLIQVNAALSNGLCAFPDKMVKRHKDFVFVASANTFGNGANRQYVGRNQLDAATLDRFAVIEWLIDDKLEESLAMGLNGKAWYMAVRAARDYILEHNIRALVTPRATQKGCLLLDAGQNVDEVIEATMLGSVPEDKKPDVKSVALKVFEKFASDVPSKLPAELVR